MSKEDPIEAKRLAEELQAFLATPLGKHILQAFSLRYNTLHQAAEDEWLTAEQKGLKVERAAGVKWAITYLTSRPQLLSEGFYDKPKDSLQIIR
jgi:hypothetical protein